jgi:uncharacterized membrane protein YfcA
VWLGLPSVTANATSTVAIWPGTLGGVWGFRRELASADRRLLLFVVPSTIGGLAGALLLQLTPTAVFDRLVPFLILFATVLFAAQGPIQRRFRATVADESRGSWLLPGIFQFLVGVYGGYFGAGIGIMMLAALSLMGLTDMFQMNGLKNLFALCINGIAAFYFMAAGMVSWPYALAMAIGAMAGGIAGAGVARRLGQRTVRHLVVAIGVAMAISLMLRR